MLVTLKMRRDIKRYLKVQREIRFLPFGLSHPFQEILHALDSDGDHVESYHRDVLLLSIVNLEGEKKPLSERFAYDLNQFFSQGGQISESAFETIDQTLSKLEIEPAKLAMKVLRTRSGRLLHLPQPKGTTFCGYILKGLVGFHSLMDKIPVPPKMCMHCDDPFYDDEYDEEDGNIKNDDTE